MGSSVPTQLQAPGISIIPVALGIAAAAFIGLIILIGIFVIIVVANRSEPDPNGRRPVAVYFFGISFLSVFVSLFASFAIVLGLVQLIGSHPNVSSSVEHPVGDAVARVAVLGGLVLLVALGLLAFHLRSGLSLPESRQPQEGPVRRVARSYLASVSFVSILIAAASVVTFAYEIFRVAGPGIFALGGPRVDGARVLISSGYLVIASAAIVYGHMRVLRKWGGWSGHVAPPVPTAPVPTGPVPTGPVPTAPVPTAPVPAAPEPLA